MGGFLFMKTHFRDPEIPPVSEKDLMSVGVNPTDLWFSPTFSSWVFKGQTAQKYPYHTTGAIIKALGLTSHLGV